jgi:hypothetical protein
MGSVTYYVAMGFERSEEGDVVAMEAMESQSSRQAVSRARALARRPALSRSLEQVIPTSASSQTPLCCSRPVKCLTRCRPDEPQERTIAEPDRSRLAISNRSQGQRLSPERHGHARVLGRPVTMPAWTFLRRE